MVADFINADGADRGLLPSAVSRRAGREPYFDGCELRSAADEIRRKRLFDGASTRMPTTAPLTAEEVGGGSFWWRRHSAWIPRR